MSHRYSATGAGSLGKYLLEVDALAASVGPRQDMYEPVVGTGVSIIRYKHVHT